MSVNLARGKVRSACELCILVWIIAWRTVLPVWRTWSQKVDTAWRPVFSSW